MGVPDCAPEGRSSKSGRTVQIGRCLLATVGIYTQCTADEGNTNVNIKDQIHRS
jgi:hypothetical protein